MDDRERRLGVDAGEQVLLGVHISMSVCIYLLLLSIMVISKTPLPFLPGASYLLVVFKLAKDSSIWKWSSV